MQKQYYLILFLHIDIDKIVELIGENVCIYKKIVYLFLIEEI